MRSSMEPKFFVASASDVECIPHVAGGVVGRNVEHREVIVVPLYLWALHYLKPHALEDAKNRVEHQCCRMELPQAHRVAGKRDVERLGL